MLVKSIAAFAALTLAAGVAAEPAPYKPGNMKMSTRDLFGVVRRQDTPGYQPEQAACNEGATCEEACGAGYQTCASVDSQIHCFNPAAGEVCCPNQSGDSCDAGYYCTSDNQGETWCCPEGMDLETCASEYEIEGGLVSQTPPAVTTTSESSSTSTSEPAPTTTAAEEEEEEDNDEEEEEDETTTEVEPSATPSFVPSASFVPSNTTAPTAVNPPAQTTAPIQEGAGNVAGPASALVFLAAGIAALL